MMPVIDPEPAPIEPELANLALAERDAIEAVQAQYDAEHGLPYDCRCADGSEPPKGVPKTILHALEPEPVERDAQGSVTSWAHPLPRAALPVALAARVQLKTRSEIDAIKAAQVPLEPGQIEPVEPKPKGDSVGIEGG